MNNKTFIVTLIFILTELVLGTILSALYINQYSFWTSGQSLQQFMVSVLLIYIAIPSALGAINLLAINRFEKRVIVRCLLTMIIFGAICTALFFLTEDMLKNYFDRIDLSSSLIVLFGFIAGFNFPVIRGQKKQNNVSQQSI